MLMHPSGMFRVEELNVESLDVSDAGHIRVRNGPNFISYTTWYADQSDPDDQPGERDDARVEWTDDVGGRDGERRGDERREEDVDASHVRAARGPEHDAGRDDADDAGAEELGETTAEERRGSGRREVGGGLPTRPSIVSR